jgi:hypothetical protein
MSGENERVITGSICGDKYFPFQIEGFQDRYPIT